MPDDSVAEPLCTVIGEKMEIWPSEGVKMFTEGGLIHS